MLTLKLQKPQPMFNRDFENLVDLLTTFNTEEKCIAHLEELYWEGIPVSPWDAEAKVWKCSNGKYRCGKTKKYFTVTTNTLFHGTQISLMKWFAALYIVGNHKKGISSCQLARDIKVSQKAAWHMLHRIFALNKQDETPMEGIVEADESMMGGKQKNRHLKQRLAYREMGVGGRSTVDKDAVFGLLERNGRIALYHVPDCGVETLQPIVRKMVVPGTVFISDSWEGYRGLDDDYLQYMIKDSEAGYQNDYNPEIHTNGIEGAWKIVKNNLRDMHNHVSTKHTQAYLDTCCFRYNTRKQSEAYRFNHLICNMGTRTKYKDLTA